MGTVKPMNDNDTRSDPKNKRWRVLGAWFVVGSAIFVAVLIGYAALKALERL